MNKLIAILTAAAITAPTAAYGLASVPVGLTAALAAAAEPELTVVGKRITGDDTYFEISLEVNGDHREYSSVGVVLEYDPTLLVPAASWNDGATEADMTGCESWATRRALPTLGLPSWTTHTALTYFDPDEPTKAYLYLGAEYPGETPNYAADPESSAAPATLTPATPAPTADPDDPHNQPVVAARFMYKAAEGGTTAITKQKIVDTWATDPVLRVADETIALESPAEYPFAVYRADFTMGAYCPTATTSPLGASGTLLNPSDIEIITCEGKSAKSGGLSLSDIYVTMFYDWDDTLLGSLTCGAGTDSSADVNSYVREKLVHPDLRSNANYTSAARTDNYRGEYPYSGPNATDPTTPGGTGCYPDGTTQTVDGVSVEYSGSSYPLTNKLEYCFAGRGLNTDADNTPLPYTGGWTLVSAADMEDVWTALSADDNFAQTVDNDGDGEPDMNAARTAYVDADGADIDLVSYNFADTDRVAADVEGGVLSVKAVYTPGENLNYGESGTENAYYTITSDISYDVLSSLTAASAVYGIEFQYKRINLYGYGVSKIRSPQVAMSLTQVGSTVESNVSVDVTQNGDTLDVLLTPTRGATTTTSSSITTVKGVEKVGYTLKDSYGTNIIQGIQKSNLNGNDGNGEFENLKSADEGFIFKATSKALYDLVDAGKKTSITYLYLRDLGIRASASSEFKSTTSMTTPRTRIQNLIQWAEGEGIGPYEITYYQYQWAVLKGQYLSADEAYSNCVSTYPAWCPFNP